jgi:phage FluMu protein Com
MDYATWLASYVPPPCPKCGKVNFSVSNPSHPTIYECRECGKMWNPDNEQFNCTKSVVASTPGE